MAAPESRSPRSVPITGKGAARGEATAGPAKEEAADLNVGEDIFRQPASSLAPRSSLDPESLELDDAASPPLPSPVPAADRIRARSRTAPPDPAAAARRSMRTRHPVDRAPGATRAFTRLVARPGMSISAHAAMRESAAEGAIDPDSPISSAYGKLAGQQQPVYRPNRLSMVLDNIFETPGLRWLDMLGSRWIKLTLLLLFFGVVGAATAWKYFGAFKGTIPSRRIADQTTPVVPMETRMERARAAFRGLLASQTVADRMPWVADPERVGARMTHFYESAGGKDPQVLTWEVGPPREHGTGSWFPVTFEEPGGVHTTIPIMEDAGGCRVDWESFVAYGDIPWATFCDQRPTRPHSLRVFLRPGGTPHPDFPQNRFRSYLVEHRDGPPRFTAYVALDGRAAQSLAAMERGTDWFSATVYLGFSDGPAASRSIIVSDVIRNRWQDEEIVRYRP